jgi:NAD-dependent DNA ligase
MARNNQMTGMAEVVEVMEPNATLKGMTFCMTGHLGKPRAEIQQMIIAAGGQVSSSLTRYVTHLITNEDWTATTVGGAGSSKYQKARGYGTKIISEAKFYEMIMQGGS